MLVVAFGFLARTSAASPPAFGRGWATWGVEYPVVAVGMGGGLLTDPTVLTVSALNSYVVEIRTRLLVTTSSAPLSFGTGRVLGESSSSFCASEEASIFAKYFTGYRILDCDISLFLSSR